MQTNAAYGQVSNNRVPRLTMTGIAEKEIWLNQTYGTQSGAFETMDSKVDTQISVNIAYGCITPIKTDEIGEKHSYLVYDSLTLQQQTNSDGDEHYYDRVL